MNHTDRWAVNESLLQSYRSIFVSSQSFLLAAGAVLTDKEPWLLYSAAAIALVMIWLVWFPVVRSRLYIVDYHKYLALLPGAQLQPPCTEFEYVHDASKRIQANSSFGLSSNWRATRIKMDVVLPIMFSSLWLLLAVHAAKYAS
jgi:hypothetical protein